MLPNGQLLVSDMEANTVWQVALDGSEHGRLGSTGTFGQPTGLARGSSNDDVYVGQQNARGLSRVGLDGIVRATIKGSGVVGVVQGVMGGITFLIVGLESALFFGVLMTIFALVPVIGAGAVYAPVGLWLLVAGEVWQGVFVLVVGFFVISSADNVLRPILVGRDTGIPDWIILVTTLGGISFLGFSGIVLGPLVAGLFLASWSILREYRDEDARAVEEQEIDPIIVDASGRTPERAAD
jgi:predicted PurR-regulated permease PerM